MNGLCYLICQFMIIDVEVCRTCVLGSVCVVYASSFVHAFMKDLRFVDGIIYSIIVMVI